jgi:alpha-L-rhamnosidase
MTSRIPRCGAGALLLVLSASASMAQQETARYGIAASAFSSGTTPVAVLMADPQARAVIARHAPALLTGPGLASARMMTLADVQPLVSGILTPAVIAAIDADLAKLPPSAAAAEQARAAIAQIDRAQLDPGQPWITHRRAFAADFNRRPVALQFRRTIHLSIKPATLPVRVSADQRFVLFVNGERVAAGPARGDLAHYRYERIDLAPYLRAGANVIAAQVWSDGNLAPVAEISAGHTGFLLKAERDADAQINTGPAWQSRLDLSRTVVSGPRQIIAQVGPTYYAAGAPERHDAALQVAGWRTGGGAGNDWQGAVAAVTQGDKVRVLVPDVLPPMRYEAATVGQVVRTNGVAAVGFSNHAAVVPAHANASLLIDLGRVMAGYPVLTTSGGKGAQVTMRYTEALYDPVAKGERGGAVRFADRAKVANGQALGLTDTFLADGRQTVRFEPFWWRAGRFVEITVTTADQPLTLNGFETRETGFPFVQKGTFSSSDPQLDAIWRTGWRTALFDAHETYMDTAYWEQLQYIGDTRIQALVSYDVAGDPRLAVQALDAFDASRMVDGLPQSSWPISSANPIPPFALLWIGMLHDYWMHEQDLAPLRRNLAGMRSVLDWYRTYVRADGMVKASPGWLFVDWRDGLDGGRDRSGAAADSCVIALLRLGALKQAADLEDAIGDPTHAETDRADAALATRGIQARCWDGGRQLYADAPDHAHFSQHANALAVLYDVAPADQRQTILKRITVPGHGIDAPAGITGTTYYFSYYLARALDHAGLADRYLDLLSNWRHLLQQHFTTWPENPDPTRSDSHAWSAHPTSGLLTYVAGVQPDAPGFTKVRIAPHLGTLTRLDARTAHPDGTIRTRYAVSGATMTATVQLPPNLSGSFAYGGRTWPLKPGLNVVKARAGHR